MPRNGSGTYSLPSGNPVVTGTTISSTTHNSTMSDLATAMTASIAKDGQTVPSANLPMGGYKHTNVASATARTEYCTAGQAQDNTFDWLSSVSGADTITATAPISMAAYAAGQCFRFTSAGANTGAVTLNVNAIGAKSLTKNGTTALAAGDIPNGAVVEIVYDGTQFQVLNVLPAQIAQINALSPSNDDFLQRKSGAWTNRTIAQVQSDLGIVTWPSQTGNDGKYLKTDGSNTSWATPMTQGTSQSLTSGTSTYFTFPSTANIVTLSFYGVQLTGSALYFRIGTSSGPVTSGYKGGYFTPSSDSALAAALVTNSANSQSGVITFRRINGDYWSIEGASSVESSGATYRYNGAINVGATASRIYMYSTDTVATFVAGTANIQYA